MRETSRNEDAVIRNITADHAREVREIAMQCGLADWSVDDYAAESFRTDAVLLGAFCDGRLSGFICGRFVPSEIDGAYNLEIYNVGVRPEDRRSGIGEKLMQHFIDIAVTGCVREIWLDVRAGNDTAIAFYRSNQFTFAGRRRNFYADPIEDAVLMTRRVTDIGPTIE